MRSRLWCVILLFLSAAAVSGQSAPSPQLPAGESHVARVDRSLAACAIPVSDSAVMAAPYQGFCHCCARPNCSCCKPSKPAGNCDEEALKKAKADFQRDLAKAKEEAAKQDALEQKLHDLYQEGEKAFDETWSIPELVVDVTSHKIKDRVFEYAADKALSEAAAELAAEIFSAALAAKTLADLIRNGLNLNVKQLQLLKEMRDTAQEEADHADAALAAMKAANADNDRVSSLEQQCSAGGGSSDQGRGEATGGDDFKSTGQRDAEAAEALLKSLKKVEGGYEDAYGNFYDANSAFEQALEVVQAQQDKLQRGPQFRPVSFPAGQGPTKGPLSPDQYNRFIAAVGRAFAGIAQGYKRYQDVGPVLKQMHGLSW